MNDEIIPTTYASWRHFITVKCGLTLSPEYIEQRLAALRDVGDRHTQEFTCLYGQAHLLQVIAWFERAHCEPALA